MIYGLIIADILMIAAFALSFNSLPPQIPLFYSRPWGEDQLVDLWFIALLPLLLNSLFFINRWVADKFFADSPFIVKLLQNFNWFLVVVFTGVFIKIILLTT